jgi:signal transduction histidine kinase
MQVRSAATSRLGLTKLAAAAATVLSRFRGLSLSRKFALLFAAILLVTLGNALVVGLLLAKLNGAAEVVNVSGSLRWRTQRIQSEMSRFAGARKSSPEFLNAAVADFEQTLERLDQLVRKSEASGFRMLGRPTDWQPLLDSLDSDFERFKGYIRSFLSAPADSPGYASLLDAGIRDAEQIFAQADALTRSATVLTEQNVDAVITTVYGLAIVDLVMLIGAFYGIRADLVKPLREVARMSRHIAAGHYDSERLPHRPRDEIGLLAAAINHMADTISANMQEMANDVVALRQQEQRILELNAQLEQRVAERTRELTAANSVLESFSYSVSHDLRGPLRSINGFSSLMSEACSACTNSIALDNLRRINRASLRMSALIDGLLHLSRITRTELVIEVIDLSQLANAVLDDLRSASPAREIRTQVQEQVRVTGDPVLLRTVLENLLRNAWKFTGRREGASIEFGSRKEEGQTIVYIRDNGAGFDPAYSDKLFTAFQRLHRAEEFEGTGIGLATVKRIIDAHKGRIWAESAPNQGATFYFAIPEAALHSRGMANGE